MCVVRVWLAGNSLSLVTGSYLASYFDLAAYDQSPLDFSGRCQAASGLALCVILDLVMVRRLERKKCVAGGRNSIFLLSENARLHTEFNK